MTYNTQLVIKNAFETLHCMSKYKRFWNPNITKKVPKKKNIYCLSLNSLFKPRESTQHFFETKEEATRIGLKYNFSDVTFSLLFSSTDAHWWNKLI